ncbi:MAG: uroporphyrinogen decarboxylase [Firmicutes bacterium]|nr:uroporphyrinogen decarboxylase [Bacillota bacterium]
MNQEEKQKLYEERLARYQAAISLEPVDRMPVGATAANYFAEVYAGYSNQEIVYDDEKWIDAQVQFYNDFPEVDVLRAGKIWAPLYDALGCNLYRIPGRDLPPGGQFQYVEMERMKTDEYDLLINSPVEFFMERYLPRTFSEFKERGSTRSYIAFLKGGLGFMMRSAINKKISETLQKKCGIPQPICGALLTPFDFLADGLRGLKGIMLDLYRKPDKVLEACDSLVDQMVRGALAGADPQCRIPIFLPLHRGNTPFLSPKQFEIFYWPSLKKTLEKLIAAGYQVRAYLEGDWSHNWHHFRELPKGSVVCDIDTQGDIYKAWEDLGGWQCIVGGMPDTTLILGSPEDVKARVKELCENIGKDGGFMITGGCSFPYDTKPENFRAYVDAVLEYGRYNDSVKMEVKTSTPSTEQIFDSKPAVITPWETKAEELGDIMGDEELIKQSWEMLEHLAYNWLWAWTW